MDLLTTSQLGYTLAIFFVAGFANGFAGFGFGLTCMAGLGLFLDLRVAVPIVAVLGVMVSSSFAYALREHLDRNFLKPLLSSALVGIPLGVLFLKRFDSDLARTLLGIVLLVFIGWTFFQKEAEQKPMARPWILPVGVVGGALGGAFNTAGPPLIAYVSTQPWAPDQARATFQIFFAFIGVFAIAGHVMTGLIHTGTLVVDAITFPAPLIGMWFGAKAGKRLNPKLFRLILRLALLAMGLSFVM